MSENLGLADVRALLTLLGELRELGAHPAEWRSHLAHTLERWCGASISLIAELRVNEASDEVTRCDEAVTPLELVDHGLDSGARAAFYRDVFFTDHATDDALSGMMSLYGRSFTVTRAEVVDERHWDRSACANDRYRVHGCDDFVQSMAPVWDLNVISSINLFCGPGRRFGARENTLVSLLHEELAKDWRVRASHGARLTPRQKQVLQQLTRGASEKEIAHDLGVSPHTAHDHVKAVYRAYGARSRGELLARFSAQHQAATRLVADSPLAP